MYVSHVLHVLHVLQICLYVVHCAWCALCALYVLDALYVCIYECIYIYVPKGIHSKQQEIVPNRTTRANVTRPTTRINHGTIMSLQRSRISLPRMLHKPNQLTNQQDHSGFRINNENHNVDEGCTHVQSLIFDKQSENSREEIVVQVSKSNMCNWTRLPKYAVLNHGCKAYDL